MYCPNCGNEINDKESFCGECGAKLHPEKRKKERRPMPIKKKGWILAAAVLIIGSAVFYYVGNAYGTPQNAAKMYQKYYNDRKWEKLYDITKTDNEFLTKNAYVSAMKAKENAGTLEAIDFGLGTEQNRKIFIKESKKRFLFFDLWKCTELKGIDIEEYQIPYVTDSEVSFDGITLNSKYIRQNISGESYYEIAAFEGKHKVIYDDKSGKLTQKIYEISESQQSFDLQYKDVQEQTPVTAENSFEGVAEGNLSDYNHCLSLGNYQQYLSEDGSYSFVYPKNFFNSASYNQQEGSYVFEASDGVSRMECSKKDAVSLGNAVSSVKNIRERYRKMLASTYFEHPKKELKADSQGMTHVILAGYTDSSRDEGIYFILASDGKYDYVMEYTYPVEDKSTDNPKGKTDYVLDCIYRGTSFSGSSKAMRSYEDFLKDKN